MEIERKFLIPDVYVKELFERDAERLEIEQYYVTVGTTEERYRRVNGDCFFAVKRDTGSSLSRLETETPCGGNDFEKNLPEKKGRIIQKERHILRYENLKIEMDFYKGEPYMIRRSRGYAPLPFMKKFLPPYFFGKEITGDARYRNRNLALNGLPDT